MYRRGEDGLLGNAPVADDTNLVDGLRRLGQGRAGRKHQHNGQRHPDRYPRQAGDESVLDLHRVGVLRRAQVLVRSKVRLHGKNMHTLIA